VKDASFAAARPLQPDDELVQLLSGDRERLALVAIIRDVAHTGGLCASEPTLDEDASS
jgi:hypothetical protein